MRTKILLSTSAKNVLWKSSGTYNTANRVSLWDETKNERNFECNGIGVGGFFPPYARFYCSDCVYTGHTVCVCVLHVVHSGFMSLLCFKTELKVFVVCFSLSASSLVSPPFSVFFTFVLRWYPILVFIWGWCFGCRLFLPFHLLGIETVPIFIYIIPIHLPNVGWFMAVATRVCVRVCVSIFPSATLNDSCSVTFFHSNSVLLTLLISISFFHLNKQTCLL